MGRSKQGAFGGVAIIWMVSVLITLKATRDPRVTLGVATVLALGLMAGSILLARRR